MAADGIVSAAWWSGVRDAGPETHRRPGRRPSPLSPAAPTVLNRLALDEALRAAAAHAGPAWAQLQIEMEGGMRPREVQSLIRAGATAEEVADRAAGRSRRAPFGEGDPGRAVRGPPGTAECGFARRGVRRVPRCRPCRDAWPSGCASGAWTRRRTWDAWQRAEDVPWTVVLTARRAGATQPRGPTTRAAHGGGGRRRGAVAQRGRAGGGRSAAHGGTARVERVRRRGRGRRGRDAASRLDGAPPRDEEPVDPATAMRQRTTVGRRSAAASAGRTGSAGGRAGASAGRLHLAVEAPVSEALPVGPRCPGHRL